MATRNANKYWNVYVNNLEQARNYTLKNNAKFLHILHPNLFSHKDLTDYEKGLRKLRACIMKLKVLMTSIIPKVRNYLKKPWHIDLSKELKEKILF